MFEQVTIYDRWDQFMYLLSAQPRRQIIASLMDNPKDRQLPLPDAAITPGVSIDPDQYEIELRQRHLPLLTEANYVRWTDEPFRVQRGSRFDEPAAVMQVLLASDDQLPPPLVSGCVEESR